MKIFKPLLILIATCIFWSCQKQSLSKPISSLQSLNLEDPSESLFIGKKYQGGKIFWLDSTGEHGLIASTKDLQYNSWSDTGILTNATGRAIGTGTRNTRRIINVLGAGGNYAARRCMRYEIDGYNDWYFPSIGELLEIYSNKDILGIPNQVYWSSTEASAFSAYGVSFAFEGQVSTWVKFTKWYVIPVRSF